MDKMVTRKQFLRTAACKASQLAIDLVSQTGESKTHSQMVPETSLAADLTPEFLEQEARRLGLDPNNPQQILNQLSTSLQRPGI
ncbi:MAG: hypothetical protein V2I50_15185 [Desulfuromusa sp.]|jgi:hypothetical protein|nr:hypothetical protein [Desulfuromusa sp.]